MAGTNKIFNREMLIIARHSRGLNQGELAEAISISHTRLSRIECGLANASDEIIKLFSQYLDYPEDFFYMNEEIYGIGVGLIYHRKRKSIPAYVIDKIHADMNIRRVHLKRLLAATYIPDCKFKAIDKDDFNGSIEDIAMSVRAALLLPKGPVKNVTKTIEDAGGVIIRWDFGTNAIDALSQWAPRFPPVFYVNNSMPCDRYRFSLVHELAHIILHTIPNPDMEDEANRFAAEFLMPQQEIKPYLHDVSFENLARLKKYWKVSMQAILMRAKHLSSITENQYRYMWSRIGGLGYRTKEPVELDITMEEPATLQALIDIHRNKLGYTVSEFSNMCNIHSHEFRHMYLGQNLRCLQ